MSKIRDKARNARYIARHPVQTWRNSPAAIGRSNRRGQQARERGRASRISAVRAAVSSRMPVYRNRINRATGRKNRDNGFMHRTRNEGLARMKERTPPVMTLAAPSGGRSEYAPPAPADRMRIPLLRLERQARHGRRSR